MKKTIKIFSLPSHQSVERTSGVDFARVIQPSTHLNGFETETAKFEVRLYDIHKDTTMDWVDVAREHDIIFFNYTALPWEFAKMGLMARKFNRLLILDLDDSLWDIMPDNPSYEAYKRGAISIKNFTSICNEVDYITTTNRYLRNIISFNTNKPTTKIRVLPNYIDLDNIYTHRSPFKNTNDITLMHFGSTTHFIDLQDEVFEKGIDMIMKDYPNVVLKTVGALIPKYKYRWGRRYINDYGHQDVYKWIKERFPVFMDETDIFVCPLANNRYTRCKSDIKRLEVASASKPFVATRIRQYEESINDGVDGMLCDTSHEWYEKIKVLIDDVELRRKVGTAGFERVVRDKQAKDHAKDYAQFFEEVLDK
jgi:glycosyltransferase involved in cell wall biosynthesis